MKLITSDTKSEILELLENLDTSFYLICPFIGIKTAIMLANILANKQINVIIITRFSSHDFYCGVSSLEGLRMLLNAGCEIKAVKALHTKLYVFDNKAFILGSSNFTNGGLISNIELNILIDNDIDMVAQGTAYFEEINSLIEKEYFIDDMMILEEINFQYKIKDKQNLSVFDDFGAELGPKKQFSNIEDIFYRPPLTQKWLPQNIWIKFEGYSDQRRTKNDLPLNIKLNEKKYYRTRFPKKPTGFRNGDMVFLARSSWDNNDEKTPVIYGFGMAQEFNELNVIPKLEQKIDGNFERWPYFIYIENFRYVTSLQEGVSLLDMLRVVGFNSYPKSSQRKDSFLDLRKIHKQKDKLRITQAAADFLLANIKPIN
jgi:HKD family nuclease